MKATIEVESNLDHEGQMMVFSTSANLVIISKENRTLMLLGRESLGER